MLALLVFFLALEVIIAINFVKLNSIIGQAGVSLMLILNTGMNLVLIVGLIEEAEKLDKEKKIDDNQKGS